MISIALVAERMSRARSPVTSPMVTFRSRPMLEAFKRLEATSISLKAPSPVASPTVIVTSRPMMLESITISLKAP